MLPAIVLAHSVELLRDGGSLGASFQGANGMRYRLQLPIIVGGDGCRKYDQPVVYEAPYASYGVFAVELSWDHARVILRQVEAQLPEGADRSWLGPMYNAIRLEGRRPSDPNGISDS